MKHFLITVLLALAGLAVAAPSAGAAPTYNNGDLFLGFRASGGTGATSDYLVNIGPASQYLNAGSSFTVTGVGNIGADLAALFGPDWHTRGDVLWSISGTNVAADPANTLYVTRGRTSPGTAASPWLGRSNSAQSVTNSKFNALTGAYLSGTTTANSSVGIIQSISDTNSYASFQPGGTAINSGGISFAAFNPSIEGNFANGVGNSVLDLFRVVPVFDQASQNVGNFTLDASGSLTFSPATVPGVAKVRFAQAQYSAGEVSAGGQVAIKLLRSGDPSVAFTVNVSTSNGTAVSGVDFTAVTNNTVSFAAGQAEATVNVTIATRTGFQGDRAFNVVLSDPSTGASLATPSSTTVTIVESEQNTAGQIAFSAADYAAVSGDAQGAPSAVTVTLNRANGATGIVTVDLSVAGGTLVNGTDYNSITNPTTITFEDGVTTKTVTIQLKPIAATKLPGTIVLGLTNPTANASIGAQSTATVTVNNRPAVAGAFGGLIHAELPSAAGTGYLALTVTPAGTFSGKVTIGSYTIPISGNFGADGKARFKPSLATTLALTAKGKPPVQLGTLELTISGDEVSGTLKNSENNVVASIGGERAFFDGKTPATSVDPKFLKNKGLYTVVLPARAAQQNLTANGYPQGDGIGTVTVNAKGVVTFKGKLADGTAVVSSAKLTKSYQWQLFAPLYKKLGSLSGVITLDDTQADSDLKGSGLVWIRPADAKAKYYPAGWAGGILTDLLGASYAVPAKTAATSVFPDLPAVDAANGNATLVFADGKLAGPVSHNVNIDAKNKVTNAPVTDKNVTLKITAPTGTISGKFLHSDNTKPAFQGVIYQKGVNAGAYGYFLSTAPKGGTGESGSVSLSAK